MEHVSSLTLTLKPAIEQQIRPYQAHSLGPYLQGVLMRSIDSQYAEMLHASSFNPYSQCCFLDSNGDLSWRINALTDAAAERLLSPVQKLESFRIHSADMEVSVSKQSLEVVPLKSITDCIGMEWGNRAEVQFLTPASFKSKGSYVILPSTRFLLQNLLMHYSMVYEGNGEADQETLEYIDRHVRIVSYRLNSCAFSNVAADGKKIPAFIGSLSFGMGGPLPMAGLVRTLLQFGEYSGVGIKTSMGMGGIRCSFKDKIDKAGEKRGHDEIK